MPEAFVAGAAQDDADAQFNLGVMYAEGHGVSLDDAEAVRWFRRAAEQGDPEARYLACRRRIGVSQDISETAVWCH